MKCPVCQRELISGPSIDEHHLLPKTHGNRNKKAYDKQNLVTLHKVCHMKIHSTFDENELFNYYHTIDRIVSHHEMQKFIKWIRKKDPEFIDTHKDTKSRRRKR